MEEIDIREYRESDIPEVLNLFERSFRKKVSEEWFLWKYRNSPWGSKGYIAAEGERVVVFYGGIKLPFGFMGRTFWAYQFCDVMTDPHYRGRFVSKRPLIVRVGEMFYEKNEMDFAFGFPSLRHARLQSLRLGGEGYRLVKAYRKTPVERRRVPWTLRIREGWEFLAGDEISRLPRSPDGSALHPEKDEKYILWRYKENPLKQYRLLVFRRWGRTRGYLVFTVEDSWVKILDVWFSDGRELKDILIATEAYAAREGVCPKGIVAWFHPDEPTVPHVDALGYRQEEDIPLAFRSVNAECGVTSETFYGRYFYRMGDYDAS